MFAKDLFNKDIMFTALLLHIFFKKKTIGRCYKRMTIGSGPGKP